MTPPTPTPRPAGVPAAPGPILGPLLRGETDSLVAWMRLPVRPWPGNLAMIVVGAGLYGAAVGMWRSPLQSLYSAAKLPLILLLTATGNALLNAVLAPLLGLALSVRQSLLSVLAGFAISAVFLGSLAPVLAFATWSLPARGEDAEANRLAFYLLQTTQVAAIAVAGFAGNARLFQLLVRLAPSRAVASRVLVAWLAGNFLLGTQVSWVLRPYFGSPNLPVQFLREHPLEGNFFESVGTAVRSLAGFR